MRTGPEVVRGFLKVLGYAVVAALSASLVFAWFMLDVVFGAVKMGRGR